jgi:RNA polymerase sigma factor (sigma-70 family)
MTPTEGAAAAGTDTAGLVEAVAARQDREAFAALFQLFAPRLKAWLLRQGADEGAAEELVQETMLAVWRRAGTYDRRLATVSTWIYTILRNKRIDRIRRERRPEVDPNDPLFQPDPPPSQDAQIDLGRAEARLRLAVAALPPEQAELIRIAFFGHLSHREIAERLGLPLGTVKSRLRLALARLRRSMDEA